MLKIVQLLVRCVKESDGKPISMKLSTGGCIGVFPHKGTKHFDCTITLDDGSRWMTGLVSSREPTFDLIARLFTEQPKRFTRLPVETKQSPTMKAEHEDKLRDLLKRVHAMTVELWKVYDAMAVDDPARRDVARARDSLDDALAYLRKPGQWASGLQWTTRLPEDLGEFWVRGPLTTGRPELVLLLHHETKRGLWVARFGSAEITPRAKWKGSEWIGPLRLPSHD